MFSTLIDLDNLELCCHIFLKISKYMLWETSIYVPFTTNCELTKSINVTDIKYT